MLTSEEQLRLARVKLNAQVSDSIETLIRYALTYGAAKTDYEAQQLVAGFVFDQIGDEYTPTNYFNARGEKIGRI